MSCYLFFEPFSARGVNITETGVSITEISKATRGSSIISWAHVNLNGEYDFTKEQNTGENLNLEKLKEVEIFDTP